MPKQDLLLRILLAIIPTLWIATTGLNLLALSSTTLTDLARWSLSQK